MKINEIRIGNYVTDLGYVGPITAINNDKVVIKHKSGIDKVDISEVEPIPLTEEWLIKMGFEKLPFKSILNSYTKSIGRERIISVCNVRTPNETIWLCEVDSDNKILTDLVCIRNYDYDKYTHVHTLQNLFYALTNEELTITQ